MTAFFHDLWNMFTTYTNIWDSFSFLTAYSIQIYTVIFLLSIIMGVYIYKLFFTLMFFFSYVTFSVYLLSPKTSWQNTVAFFSVTGVVFSFLAYQWSKLAACVISIIIGGLTGYFLFGTLPAAVAGIFLFFFLCYLFPLHTLCIEMPLFGALGIYDLYRLPLYVILAIFIAGVLFNMLISRKQTMFTKIYPDRVRYMLEKRKLI